MPRMALRCFLRLGSSSLWSPRPLPLPLPLPLPQVLSSSSSSGQGLKLSDSCVAKLKEITAEDGNTYLRILVQGGGCSGFTYKFELEDRALDGEDRSFQRDGAKVVIDETSLEYLQGEFPGGPTQPLEPLLILSLVCCRFNSGLPQRIDPGRVQDRGQSFARRRMFLRRFLLYQTRLD